ncbi:hypothetical protein N7G274_004125 [Stereocaulon virgatum]|uniref:Uncharacterized protein n=1 Tax=Stereocaulon virgatum TaxID=373712 RepID=A0ABR4AD57_9LECA
MAARHYQSTVLVQEAPPFLAVQRPEASDGNALTGFPLDVSHIPTVIAGFNCKLARLNQSLGFRNKSYAAVAQASRIVGAANNLMPYITEKQPQLGLTLDKVGTAVRSLIFGNLAAGFQGSVL